MTLVILMMLGFSFMMALNALPAGAGRPIDEEEEKPQEGQLTPEALKQIREGAQAEILTQIQNDPEIGQLLRLRAAGKKAQVVEEGVERDGKTASSQPQTPPSPPDFSKMDEGQRMKYLIDQVKNEMVGVVKAELKPVDQRLSMIEGFGNDIKRKDIVSQVDAVKKKYGESEFEALKPQMAALLTENPNMSAERLFLLASAENGRLVSAPRRTTSEKPSNVLGRPHERKDPVRQGVGGMRELLSGATSKVYERVNGDNEQE